MDIHEIVKKLVGSITPIGETTTDNERFENLQVICNLVENLIMDLDDMVYYNRNSCFLKMFELVRFVVKKP